MKKRILIALVACLTLAIFATSASAATAGEKYDKFKACLASAPVLLMRGGPGRYETCCKDSGGVYDSSGGTESCMFTSDRVTTGGSVRPPDLPIVVTKP